jgi:hypothetical protein
MPEQRKGILDGDPEEIATFELEAGRFRVSYPRPLLRELP